MVDRVSRFPDGFVGHAVFNKNPIKRPKSSVVSKTALAETKVMRALVEDGLTMLHIDVEVTTMTGKKIVNWKNLKADYGIPYSRTHIMERLVKQGRFPRPFKIGDYRNSPPCWYAHEIEAWIESKASARAA